MAQSTAWETILDTKMTVGSGGVLLGFQKYTSQTDTGFGSMDDCTVNADNKCTGVPFTLDGTSYSLTDIYHGLFGDNNFYFRSSPELRGPDLNSFRITVDDTVYEDGWCCTAKRNVHNVNKGTLSLTSGDTNVTVKIEVPKPDTGPSSLKTILRRDTMLGFSWNNNGWSYWQHRHRTDSAGWSGWVDGESTPTVYLYTLVPGTKYYLQVRSCRKGHAEATCGPTSEITATTTGDPPKGPDAPANLRAKSFVNAGSALQLDWDDDDQPWFQVRHKLQTDTNYGDWSVRFTTNRRFLTGLTSGRLHDFQVRACNHWHRGGLCSAGTHIQARTWGLVVPAPPAPTGLRVTHRWPRAVWIRWHRTTYSPGGRYWQYQVCEPGAGQACDANQNSGWSDWRGYGNTGKRLVAEMRVDAEPGKSYKFRVRACNTEQNVSTCGPAIASVEATTPTRSAVGNVQGQSAGSGRVRVNWQAPDNGGAGGEGASGAGVQAASAPGVRSAGARAAEDDPPEDDPSDAYEVAWTPDGAEWSEGGSRQVAVTDTSATVEGLTNGQRYAFRVRIVQGAWQGAWSDTVYVTPAALPATLVRSFADLSMANGAARRLDMAEHFSGDGLSFGVTVTTTHKRTGEVKTAPLNTVARNKMTGSWSDDVLTLTAGPSGHHVLTLTMTATDGEGGTASDSFELTVDGTGAPGRPEAPTAVAGDGTVALTWAAPDHDGGEAVASYDVDIGVDGDWSAGPDRITGIAGTSRTVSGLTNGTAYDFRVRAVNGAGAGEWSEAVVSTPKVADEAAAPSAPTALEGMSADGGVALAWSAPADDGGAAIASYEVDIGIGGDWSAGPDPIADIAETGKIVTGLVNGTAYDFRVRAANGAGAGAWSETVSVTPAAPATLILALPDLELANGEVHAIDMTQHFTGTGLAYEVMVTTTHKRTGQVKTGPINTVARNKVRGAWSGDVLTLTAGPSGHHVLGMEVIATDLAGGTASDEFQLIVGTSETESLAAEALRNALASQARSMLEDASSAIGGRMQSGVKGTDALTAFAGLFGGGRSVSGCPLEESLEECMTRDADHRDAPRFGGTHGFGPLSFDWNREDEGGESVDLSEFRDRVKTAGFAVSLNQPLAFASSADGQTGAHAPGGPAPEAGMALTFWGRGGSTSGSTDTTLFWGLDASMGERWMAGLAFAESGAEVAQSLSQGDASVSDLATSEISAVYPYLRSHFGSGLEVWSLMGWGSGRVDSRWTGASLTSASEETVHLDGEVAFDLGLVGAEQTLFEGGGFSLLALGDAGWSRLAATSGRTQGIEATVSRTRLGVEGRYVSADGALSSSLRAGARVDGGDGQTASGMELLGDVRRTWGRWQAGVEGRWYAADTADAGHGSQGVKAGLSLQPRANGTGLGLTISPGWGAQSEALKQDGLLAAFEEGAPGQVSTPAAHLDGRLSWGMRLPGQGLYGPGELLSPYAEFSFVEDGTRHLRTGLVLEGSVGMGLALERREGPTNSAEHGIMLRLDTRF